MGWHWLGIIVCIFGAKASCLVYVFEEGDELVFELGVGSLGRTWYVVVS